MWWAQVTPDHAGYREAQDRLRDVSGEDVEFRGRRQRTWPPGTPLDPETGRPYDPMIEPTATTQPELVVRCGVTFRAINRASVGGETETGAAGRFDSDHVMLNAPLDRADDLADMQEFSVRGDAFRITSQKGDGIGGLDRHLVFGRRL